MAVTKKPNEEYWALKARIDKWGVWLYLAGPFLGITSFAIFGFILGGRLFDQPIFGIITGLICSTALLIYLIRMKIGFVVESEETCQSCNIHIGYLMGGGFATVDYLCRRCGNNNSIDLHDA